MTQQDVTIDEQLDFFFRLASAWNQISINHANSIELSRLHRACVPLLAPAYSIVFAIEALLRDHHLFAAELLQRPLLERVGVLNFLLSKGEFALALWEHGWNKDDKNRPRMTELIDAIPELAKQPHGIATELTPEEFKRQTLLRLHSVVHADPIGALRTLMPSDCGVVMVSGPMQGNPTRRQEVGVLTAVCVSALLGVTERIFPEAGWPMNKP
jgi:hypothetical protein